MSDLRLVLAEVWQGEGRLRINAVMVDVSLGGHKHQLTASAEQEEIRDAIMQRSLLEVI